MIYSLYLFLWVTKTAIKNATQTRQACVQYDKADNKLSSAIQFTQNSFTKNGLYLKCVWTQHIWYSKTGTWQPYSVLWCEHSLWPAMLVLNLYLYEYNSCH